MIVVHPSEVLNSLLQKFVETLTSFKQITIRGILKLSFELELDSFEFVTIKRVNFAFPLPIKVSLAVVRLSIEDASCTDLLVNNGHGLQPIGQDDIGVHGCYIDVVN